MDLPSLYDFIAESSAIAHNFHPNSTEYLISPIGSGSIAEPARPSL
jgi:hypothetical protein